MRAPDALTDSTSDQETIRKSFERNRKTLELRPKLGQGTAVTTARITEGMKCEVSEGPWKLTVDMSKKSGGTDAGPNPGVLGRGALGSCLAIGYTLWAEKLGVPMRSVEVHVHADYDSRGYHGVDNVAPGYSRVRYVVTVESDAPQADILHMLDEADKHSPYLDVFSTPQNLSREVRVLAPEANP